MYIPAAHHCKTTVVQFRSISTTTFFISMRLFSSMLLIIGVPIFLMPIAVDAKYDLECGLLDWMNMAYSSRYVFDRNINDYVSIAV